MPQYSFSSIVSLATSQHSEKAKPSDEGTRSPESHQQPYVPNFAPHQAQLQPSQPQQPSFPAQQQLKPQPNTAVTNSPYTVAPTSSSYPPEQAVPHTPAPVIANQSLAPGVNNPPQQQINSSSIMAPTTQASSRAEQLVRHTIVTQQPQLYPDRVPPIVISTRIQSQPSVVSAPSPPPSSQSTTTTTTTAVSQQQLPQILKNPPKVEQLESDDEETEGKAQAKEESGPSSSVRQEEGEDEEKHKEVGTMTATGERTMLDGLILTETKGGLLVVNVMYKNKEFVGALMDCQTTSNNWAAPRHSEVPPPDKKPKKKKKAKSSGDNRMAPRIGLRNRRRIKKRERRDKRLSWDPSNRGSKSGKRMSF